MKMRGYIKIQISLIVKKKQMEVKHFPNREPMHFKVRDLSVPVELRQRIYWYGRRRRLSVENKLLNENELTNVILFSNK